MAALKLCKAFFLLPKNAKLDEFGDARYKLHMTWAEINVLRRQNCHICKVAMMLCAALSAQTHEPPARSALNAGLSKLQMDRQ